MINSHPTRNLQPIEDETLRKRPINETKYRGAIRSILYSAINTKPDILFAVNKAARKSKNPNMDDWVNVTKIMRYFKGTENYALNFTKNSKITAFIDAD